MIAAILNWNCNFCKERQSDNNTNSLGICINCLEAWKQLIIEKRENSNNKTFVTNYIEYENKGKEKICTCCHKNIKDLADHLQCQKYLEK